MPLPSFIAGASALPSMRPLMPGAVVWAGGLGLFLATACLPPRASAQTVPAPSPAASAPAGKQVAAPVSKPLWRDLTAKQQQALQPLAPHWDGLDEPQKRKWLALSRNHAKLSPAEQATLNGRMTEWAKLSRQQRAQARFNFDEVKQLPAEERKAKWEAYQALSEDERRKLGERAATRAPGAATTLRSVPAQKLAPVPEGAAKGKYSPRIQLAPPSATASTGPAPTPAAVQSAPVPAEAQSPPPVPVPAAPSPPLPARIPPVPVTDPPSSAP